MNFSEELATIQSLESLEDRKVYILSKGMEINQLISVCQAESSSFLPELLKVLQSLSEDVEKVKAKAHSGFVITEEVRKREWGSDYYLEEFERDVRNHKRKLFFSSKEEADAFFKPLLVKIIRLINFDGQKRIVLKHYRGKEPIFYDLKTFQSNYGPKNGYIYRAPKTERGKIKDHWWFELIHDPSLFTYYNADWIPYHPLESDPTSATTFNLFRGFKDQPIPSQDYSEIGPIVRHIHEVWAKEDRENVEYIMSWFAHLIQFPRKWLPMLTLIGDEGVGKTTLIQWMIDEIFGEENCGTIFSLDEATKKFNGIIHNKILTYIQELKAVSDSSMTIQNKMDKFKSMITDKRVLVERKGIDPYHISNFNHWIGTSNHDIPFSLQEGNRRHVIFHCSAKYRRDRKYFDELHSHLTPANAKIFYHFLLQYPIKRDVYDIPSTESLETIMNVSLPMSKRFINELKDGDYKIQVYSKKDELLLMSRYPDIFFRDPLLDYKEEGYYAIGKKDLYSCFCHYCKTNRISDKYTQTVTRFYADIKNLFEEKRIDNKPKFIVLKEWFECIKFKGLEQLN